MRRMISALILLAATGAAEACPSFGFETSYLSEFFCRQFDEFSESPTRSVGSGSDRGPAGGDLTLPEPEWLTLPRIERAWRSDPAKTLRLIERIRDAGGRPVK